MRVCIHCADVTNTHEVFTATLRVTNMHEKLQTLVNRISHPLHSHYYGVDLNKIVFKSEYGPAFDMNSTFATLFGPTTENVDLWIGYRHDA